jgi:cytochrome c oxidase cbb3-type subunit III
MTHRASLLAALIVTAISLSACSHAPGRPGPNSEVLPPDKILDFNTLYAQNCAGCHGRNGLGGASVALANPQYLAMASDDNIRTATANGVPGTLMPAFAQSSGGMLTDAQINVLVSGMRTQWARPKLPRRRNAPSYRQELAGDRQRGSNVYATYCASCHGASGHGSPNGSSIVDASYLALVSDQGLRMSVILGSPDGSSPDWSNYMPGQPMSPQDIADVVAWLSAKRPQPADRSYSAMQPQSGGVQ